jgi:2-amino-4-hydroxy-6-hydroxymethyldihydropteridine diphosphokinase
VTRVYIGIGSNLSEPRRQVERAIDELTQLPDTRLLASSRLYRSAPLGPVEQPDYINAVAALDSDLDAHALLDELLRIELAHGRVRGERWGPRTIDLDLLLYGDEVINDDRLTVPHPGLRQRNFVLYPLRDIAPDLVIPGNGTVSAVTAQCPRHDLTALPEHSS